MRTLLFAVWVSRDQCGFTPICGDQCILGQIHRRTGNPPADLEIIMAGWQEALRFRAEALEHGVRIKFVCPGMEPTDLDETGNPYVLPFLEAASVPALGVYPARGDQVSITTNGSNLWREPVQRAFLKHPLDLLRFSGNIDAGLHVGSPLGAIIRNAARIQRMGGCRLIQLASSFTGKNISGLVDLYSTLQIAWRGKQRQSFLIHEHLDDLDGVFVPRPSLEEVDELIETFVGIDSEYGSGIKIVIELQPEHFLHATQLDDFPPEPLLVATRILASGSETSMVELLSFNPRNDAYLSIRIDGMIGEADELRTTPKRTRHGMYEPGKITEILRDKVSGYPTEKWRHLATDQRTKPPVILGTRWHFSGLPRYDTASK